jgi:holliday junction DNA helicase RuvA
MIASLEGKVSATTAGSVVVDVGGVGYLVQVPTSVIADARAGNRIRLLVHMVVRDDALLLYGFVSARDRDAFQALIGVTGVGPKIALAVISGLGAEGLARAVAAGDVDAICEVPGIGKRGAQRMVLELKEKLGVLTEVSVESGSKLSEVRQALTGLGYTPAEAREAMERVPAEGEVQELIRAALKELSRV